MRFARRGLAFPTKKRKQSSRTVRLMSSFHAVRFESCCSPCKLEAQIDITYRYLQEITTLEAKIPGPDSEDSQPKGTFPGRAS